MNELKTKSDTQAGDARPKQSRWRRLPRGGRAAVVALGIAVLLAVAAFLASRVIFRRDIDKALQAEKAAAEEKSTETATPAETVPAEPEEESNEEKKEEA